MDGKPLVYLYQVPFAPEAHACVRSRNCREAVEAEVGPVYWMMDKIANPNGSGLTFPDEWLKISEIPMLGFYGTFSVKRIWKYADLAPDYARLATNRTPLARRCSFPHIPVTTTAVFGPTTSLSSLAEDGTTLRGYLRAATEAGADVVAADQLQRVA